VATLVETSMSESMDKAIFYKFYDFSEWACITTRPRPSACDINESVKKLTPSVTLTPDDGVTGMNPSRESRVTCGTHAD
jgi:hypothetical protein